MASHLIIGTTLESVTTSNVTKKSPKSECYDIQRKEKLMVVLFVDNCYVFHLGSNPLDFFFPNTHPLYHIQLHISFDFCLICTGYYRLYVQGVILTFHRPMHLRPQNYPHTFPRVNCRYTDPAPLSNLGLVLSFPDSHQNRLASFHFHSIALLFMYGS